MYLERRFDNQPASDLLERDPLLVLRPKLCTAFPTRQISIFYPNPNPKTPIYELVPLF